VVTYISANYHSYVDDREKNSQLTNQTIFGHPIESISAFHELDWMPEGATAVCPYTSV